MSASGGTPRSGTMSEPQVRAMFDRIAGFYDVMNSVMTVGLHHRWRARAADLAALAPGDSALDVACGTGDLAIELARRVGAGRRGHRLGLRRGDARARPRQGAGGVSIAWEWGNALELPYASGRFRRGDRRLRGAQLLRPRPRAGRDDPGGQARRARRRARDHHAAQAARCRPSTRCGSTASCRSSGASPGEEEAYTYLPSSVRRFPGPEGLAAAMQRAGLGDIRWILTAGGIIALHVGTKR